MTAPLIDYAGASTPVPAGRGPRRFTLAACFALTLVAVSTCARVEWLNNRAGGMLPKTFEGKWRALARPESAWRNLQARQAGDPSLATRPLTSTEHAAMRTWAEPREANRELRDVVGTWGALQYPAVVLGILFAVRIARGKEFEGRWRIGASVCLAAILAAGVLMVYRGYFTSVID